MRKYIMMVLVMYLTVMIPRQRSAAVFVWKLNLEGTTGGRVALSNNPEEAAKGIEEHIMKKRAGRAYNGPVVRSTRRIAGAIAVRYHRSAHYEFR